jgi:hypothetical protein
MNLSLPLKYTELLKLAKEKNVYHTGLSPPSPRKTSDLNRYLELGTDLFQEESSNRAKNLLPEKSRTSSTLPKSVKRVRQEYTEDTIDFEPIQEEDWQNKLKSRYSGALPVLQLPRKRSWGSDSSKILPAMSSPTKASERELQRNSVSPRTNASIKMLPATALQLPRRSSLKSDSFKMLPATALQLPRQSSLKSDSTKMLPAMSSHTKASERELQGSNVVSPSKNIKNDNGIHKIIPGERIPPPPTAREITIEASNFLAMQIKKRREAISESIQSTRSDKVQKANAVHQSVDFVPTNADRSGKMNEKSALHSISRLSTTDDTRPFLKPAENAAILNVNRAVVEEKLRKNRSELAEMKRQAKEHIAKRNLLKNANV